MSRQYTVKSADTLSQVAARVYGDPSRWPEIWRANQSRLRSGDPNKVYPGEILIIPEPEKAAALSGKQPDDLTIVAGGRELRILNARIIRTMDTGADAWTSRIDWEPGADPELDRIIRPYGYPNAAAYIGGELLVNGLLYTVEPELTTTGRTVALTGYSFTADAVDSTLKPPYERNNITLEQLAAEVVEPLGIRAIFRADTGGPFARVTANEGDTIFDHLAHLAAQRGILVSSTTAGDLLFWKAATDSPLVGTIEEGQPLATGYRAKYDGRRRFNAYKCITADAGASLDWEADANPKTQIALDNAVPRSRFLTFKTDDTTPGNILNAAEWRRSRQTVEALTMSFPVPGWHAPDGSVWRENTRVSIVSRTLGVPRGFTFLIRSVEYILENNRREAVLSLVPPQVYTGETMGDIWK
jgi:prophage tail gpP-like protein